MNSNAYAQNQSSSSFRRFVLIAALVLFGLTAERTYGQWCQTPILQDVPLNDNQQPRYDTTGNVVDAHDGMLIQFGTNYYLYGTAYGNTGGFQTSPPNRYACYTSTDLVQWTLASSDLFPGRTNNTGLYFRPHVIYNQANNQYVLWYNWWPSGSIGYLGIATSSVPTGPFTTVTTIAQENGVNVGSGDLNLFVDNDTNQTAYIIYTAVSSGPSGFEIYVEKLTPNYLGLTGSKVAVNGQGGQEAPILFKKDSTYYAMMGSLCCFCLDGSGCSVYECQQSSAGPLGTWSTPPSGYPTDINNGFVPTQPTYVAKIATSLAGDRYIWMGDMWSGGANGNQNGCGDVTGPPDRGLERQYWSAPLEFISGHVLGLAKASNSGTLVLTNESGQTWGDAAQVVLIHPDGTTSVLGYRTAAWNPGVGWSMPLTGLTSGGYYSIELQDIFNNTTNFVPSVKSFVANGTAGTISGYMFRIGTGGYYGGGYWGWYAAWDGPRTLDMVNLSGQTWGDTAQVVAVPSGGGSTIVLGYRTTAWNPYSPTDSTTKWSMDLTPLSIGNYYTVELQDIFNGTTNTLSSSNYILAGQPILGYITRPGGGGYFGWFSVWDNQPSTLSLTNNSSQTWGDSARIVAYLNNAGSPIVVGSRSGSWSAQQPWTISLSGLTVGCSYTFELQDTSFGNAVIPPRSNLTPILSGKALGNGSYVYYNGSGGYFGWHTQWGW